ncbi:MAG: tripartite tricarboxylate transporter TctB family protein [Acidobacteria bacterium]|nr:tripartite tricarboxylate transporter TctB family protein [Acidobacteriota bacterium]
MARQEAASGARPGRHAGPGDRGLGAGLLAIGGGYLAAAFLISEPEGGYAAVGPRVFPVAIGIALVAVALRTAFRTRGGTGAPSSGTAEAQTAPAPASDAVPPAADWRAAAPSALIFLAYILLLEPLGYLLATAAFIALEARLLGSRRWRRDLLAALVVSVSVYALFSLLLGLRLPAGLLGGP